MLIHKIHVLSQTPKSILLFPCQQRSLRRREKRPLPAPGKFFELLSSTILDETKPLLKYRFFVALVTHLLRMSRFIDCWNHCEPTLQNRKPVCRGHVSFFAMRHRRMLDRILAGGRQRSLSSLSFSRRLRDLC